MWLGEKSREELCALLLDLFICEKLLYERSNIELHPILDGGGRSDVATRVVVAMILDIELLAQTVREVHQRCNEHELNDPRTQKDARFIPSPGHTPGKPTLNVEPEPFMSVLEMHLRSWV